MTQVVRSKKFLAPVRVLCAGQQGFGVAPDFCLHIGVSILVMSFAGGLLWHHETFQHSESSS
jgi:hypothetical protein